MVKQKKREIAWLERAGLSCVTFDAMDENGVRYYDAVLDGVKVCVALGALDATIEADDERHFSRCVGSLNGLADAIEGAVAYFREGK